MVLFKESRLLLGFISVFVAALAGNLILTAAGAGTFFRLGMEGQAVSHTDGLWNFLGMFLTGYGCVLLGGCPLRQLILSGEGNTDSAITVIGLMVGALLPTTSALPPAEKDLPQTEKSPFSSVLPLLLQSPASIHFKRRIKQ